MIYLEIYGTADTETLNKIQSAGGTASQPASGQILFQVWTLLQTDWNREGESWKRKVGWGNEN